MSTQETYTVRGAYSLATGYADTAFSVPACTRYRGKYVSGFFTNRETGVVFVPHTKHAEFLGVQS